MTAHGRVLVAGIGNIFFGDDGFGVEVVRRLAARGLASPEIPGEVKIADFGIRGLHLAYEMVSGYDVVILIDAVPRGAAPGTLCVIEPDLQAPSNGALADAHGMTPDAVLSFVRVLGGCSARVVIVACEPERVDEGIGLSAAVEGAADRAVASVVNVVKRELQQRGSPVG
jgi:hydrogenase maturation protease